MTRLASWTMEANTLSFYRSLGKEPPAWDFLPTAAQFICASAAALRACDADETHPPGHQASGDRSSTPGALQPRQGPAATESLPAAGSGNRGGPNAVPAAPCHPRSRVVFSEASSDDWASSEEDEVDYGPCWVTREHIEAISEGLAILEARAEPAAPARRGVPLEWGSRTTVLGLVDPNPGGMQPWVLECAAARAFKAHEIWVRQPGALFAACGPYGSMASGVPLPLMAKMVKNLSACRNGFGPTDEDELMEEADTGRPPTGASPTLRAAPGEDAEHVARHGRDNGR